MKTFILSFFLLLLSSSIGFAANFDWTSPYCPEECTEPEKASLEDVSQTLDTYLEINQASQNLLNTIDSQIDHWADFMRWLKKDEPKNPIDLEEFKSRWENLNIQARSVLELERNIQFTKNKLSICYKSCSAVRRVELEVQLEHFERLKLHFLSHSPWWLSKDFEKIIEKSIKNENYIPLDEELRSVLISSLRDFFFQMNDIKKDLYLIGEKTKNPDESNLMDKLILSHGQAIDLILKKEIMKGDQTLCSFAKLKMKWDQRFDNLDISINALLITSIIIAGPENILMGSIAKKFSTQVGKIFAAVGPAVPSTLLTQKMLHDFIVTKDECENRLALTKLGEASSQDWRECVQKEEQQKIGLILMGMGTAAQGVLPITYKLYSHLRPLPAKSAVKMIDNKDGTTTSILNLSERKALQAENLDNVPDRYWEFVGDIYRKKLNLSEAEIKSFITSSKMLEGRTQLITSTRGAPHSAQFEGGIALIKSHRRNDILPLEKATGITLPRGNGGIAEIGRLTSVNNTNIGLMKELLKQTGAIVQEDHNIKTLYVYTSKVHLRLYRTLGIPIKVIDSPSKRDVLIEVNAQTFINVTSTW